MLPGPSVHLGSLIQFSYGDAGFQAEDRSPGTCTILAQMYFLTGTTINVGAAWVNYYDHPLQVQVSVYALRPKIYLSLQRR